MRNLDPEQIGQRLLRLKHDYPDTPLHKLADSLDWDSMPTYDPEASTVNETVLQYIGELNERKANGDMFATGLLDHLHKHGSFNGAQKEPVE